MQRLANRLVYGKRATPYEILSEFSARMAATSSAEDLLPPMARILAQGTGAARADVWLKVGGDLRDETIWPPDAPPFPALPATAAGPLTLAGADRILPVVHQGELLGALSVSKRPGEPLTPTENKLLADLAAQAGLVLRNAGLREQLLARLEEIREKSPVPTAVTADGIARYPRDVEAVVYFCVLEALQNISKYAGATRARVRLAASGDELEFEVADDGAGFDPEAKAYGTGLQGMADRLNALGGTLDVWTSPGAGTVITGRLGAREHEVIG